MGHSPGGGTRDTDTDWMRIAASFCVVLIHIPRPYSLAGAVYSSVTRFSVPVFCMISGYYLLDRQEEPGRLLRKSLRAFLLMAAWAGIYYGYELAAGKLTFEGLPALVAYLLTMPTHLWYIYALIALYLFTPPLGVFARGASRREYQYTLALTFTFGSVVTLALRTGRVPLLETVVEKMKLDPTLGFVFCYLWAGYDKRFGLSRRERQGLYICALAGTAVPVALFLALGERSEEANSLLFSFFSPNALAQGMAFFAGTKELWSRRPALSKKAGSRLRSLASCTLGVYLVHPLVIELTDPWLQGAIQAFRPWLTIPVRAAAAYALSLLAVLAMRRTPAIKKLVSL